MDTGRSIRAFLRCCILLGGFIIASSTAAIADRDYPTSIINDSDSPATLTKCELWARDWNKTYLEFHSSVPNALAEVGAAFTNTSSEPINVIRVKLAFYDAFDSVLEGRQFDSTSTADKMSVAPGSSFDLLGSRDWHGRNDLPQSLDHASCEITAVKFADGTAWTVGSSPPSPQVIRPTPSSSTPPSRSTAPGVSPSPRPQTSSGASPNAEP